MTPSDLAAWRQSMTLSQRAAAAALGVSLPTYQRLERGAEWADGAPVQIDRRTALACAALAAGLGEWRPATSGVIQLGPMGTAGYLPGGAVQLGPIGTALDVGVAGCHK